MKSYKIKMTSLLSSVVTGHVVPGDPTPLQRKWITSTPYGPPIIPEAKATPTAGAPKKLGDEQHHAVMGELQKILVAQKSEQIQEALPRRRDWR